MERALVAAGGDGLVRLGGLLQREILRDRDGEVQEGLVTLEPREVHLREFG